MTLAVGLTALLASTTALRLTGQTAPDANTTALADDQAIELSPFVVSGEDDKGYRATSTLAGTRIKTDLRDVGSAISVITSKFLHDTGATNNQDLLVYTASTEVGGVRGNFTGLGNAPTLDESEALLRPQQNTRVRGLGQADNTRDFFLTDIPWDAYNVERVDLQRGPNSILFGVGHPAGIINSSTNIAMFKDENTVEFRYGSYDSKRSSADINKVLIPGQLAVRFDGLYNDQRYEQNPAYQLDKRLFGAVRYDPAFLNRGPMRTSIKANFEVGHINANRPRVLAPYDQITPWFTNLNKALYDPFVAWENIPARAATNPMSGVRQPGTPNFNPWTTDFANIVGGPTVIYPSAGSGDYRQILQVAQTHWGLKSDGTVDNAIDGIPFSRQIEPANLQSWARLTNQPGSELGLWKENSITDPTIFDFYHHLIDGPNKSEISKWRAANVNFSQNFFDNRFGYEAVYDRQRYFEKQESMLSGNTVAIGIDLNTKLLDGEDNPDAGRPFVSSHGLQGNRTSERIRTNERLTAYADLRAADFFSSPFWVKMLGHHTLTGLASRDTTYTDERTFDRYVTDDAFGAFEGLPAIDVNDRQVGTISYLGPVLTGVSSPHGLNLQPLTQIQNPPTMASVRVFDSHWTAGASVNPADPWYNPTSGSNSTQSENPANYGGWKDINVRILNADKGDIDRMYVNANLLKDQVSSQAFVWQGFLADGTIVPMWAVRRDTDKAWVTKGTDHRNPDNTISMNNPDYRLSSDPQNIESGTSKSWSLVVHTPHFLRKHLPWNSDVSVFYNHSSNFQPAAGRLDALGHSIASPSGKTDDYGFVVSTLDDKISLKFNWYKTEVTNDSNPTLDASLWNIGAMEAWGYHFAKVERTPTTFYAPDAWNLWTKPDGTKQTVAEAQAQTDAAADSFLSQTPPTGDSFYNFWGIDRSTWNSWVNFTQPAGITATADTVSKGMEIELTAQPTKHLSLMANATRTNAVYSNVGSDLATYVAWADNKYNNTPAGDVRLWGPWADPTTTIKYWWNSNFMSTWNLLKLQEGSQTPEERKWRFNLVANYDFGNEGLLKGFSAGGAYRWSDRQVIGYKYRYDSAGIPQFDLSDPYRGPTDKHLDLWFGYERRFAHNIRWRIQLNLRNAFEHDHLIPITAQPNGTPAAYAIGEPMTWELTNTFHF